MKINTTDKEIIQKLYSTINLVDNSLTKYRFADAGEAIYHFMWSDLANDYLESIKGREDQDVALSVFRYVYSEGIKLLHPFMPFVTEAIWSHISHPEKTPLIISSWPTSNS